MVYNSLSFSFYTLVIFLFFNHFLNCLYNLPDPVRQCIILVDPWCRLINGLSVHLQPRAQLSEPLLVDWGQGPPRSGSNIDQNVSTETVHKCIRYFRYKLFTNCSQQ